MNYRQIIRLLSNILFIEALFLIPSVFLSLYDGEMNVLWALLITISILIVTSLLIKLLVKPLNTTLYTRDGFVLVAVSWILTSVFGALPFFIRTVVSYEDCYYDR